MLRCALRAYLCHAERSIEGINNGECYGAMISMLLPFCHAPADARLFVDICALPLCALRLRVRGVFFCDARYYAIPLPVIAADAHYRRR